MSSSVVLSDSDSEAAPNENTSQPKPVIRPRVVHRPRPLTSKVKSQLSGRSEDEDEEDEDSATSFFNLSRPRLPQPILHQPTTAHLRHISEVEEEEEEEKGDEYISDSDKDNDVDILEVSSASNNGEKRKNNEKGSLQRRRPRRSLSLTPPPTEIEGGQSETVLFTPTSKRAGMQQQAPVGNSEPTILDSDNEVYSRIQELDPALQAVLRKNKDKTPLSPPSIASVTKAQVEFKFMYDQAFVTVELSEYWDKKRWRKVQKNHKHVIADSLNSTVAVVMYSYDALEKGLRAFSDAFFVDVLATNPVLTVDELRVYPTTVLSSLGSRAVYYVKAYPKSVYDRKQRAEDVEKQKLALEQAQTLQELEMTRGLKQSLQESGRDDVIDLELGNDEGGQKVKALRVKIRDKTGKDTLLKVAVTTSIQTIIENYRKIAGLGSDKKITLEFDDERLSNTATIEDTELEDDDMIMALWK